MDGDLEVPDDHVDMVRMGKFHRKHEYKVILRELRRRLTAHGAMMDEWNKKIGWLWDRCQPDSSRTYKLDWDEMMDHIQRGSPIDPAVFEGVNELREETVLDIDLDHGEDAEGDWIDEMETPHVDQHADANDSNDPEDY